MKTYSIRMECFHKQIVIPIRATSYDEALDVIKTSFRGYDKVTLVETEWKELHSTPYIIMIDD